MHKVDITVHCIAQTRMNKEEVRKWLDTVGAVATSVPQTDEVTDGGATIGLAAKRCYMSFEPGLNPNVTQVRKKWHTYLENILAHQHGSVLEHATWTFAIEGLTRVATAELNRHRAGAAISEGSLRYIRFDDIPYWEPTSLQPGSTSLDPEMDIEALEARKEETRRIFADVFHTAEVAYKHLLTIWNIDEGNFERKKKLTSLFRRIIPMGVATGGVWTWNMRAIRHIVAMRTSPHAEEEIAHVIGLVAKQMCESEPDLIGDFTEESGVWTPKYPKV